MSTTDTSDATTDSTDLTRPATFDLEGWIAGHVVPTRIVPVTSKAATADQIRRLVERKTDIELAMSQIEGTPQTKRRLAQKDDRKEQLRTINAEIDRLTPTLDGTWADVQVRSLTPAEVDAVRRTRPKPGYDTTVAMIVVAGKVRPQGVPDAPWAELDSEGWDRLFSAIGTAQYQTIETATHDLTFGQVVDADFFTRPSASPDTQDSSQS